MLTELLLNILKGALTLVISIIPSMESVQLPDELLGWFTDILNMTAYFLPVPDLLLMLSIFIAVTNWEIIWKTVTRIWDALPFT